MIRKSRSKRWMLAGVIICLLLMTLIPAAARAEAEPDGPRLMRVSPSQPQLAGRDITIALSFDRPMELSSISEAASFDPPVAFAVSGEAECLIVPSDLLEGGREYSFRLEAGRVRDRSGNKFAEGLELRFTTRNEAMCFAVPGIGFDGDVLEGKDAQAVASVLGFGVGKYPGTGRPGAGNLVLMAHASGQIYFPFNRLQELKAEDELRVRYGGQTFVYKLGETMVVAESAIWILDPQGYAMLTIFVCCAADGKPSPTFHPPYRYVVRAALTGVNP